MTDQRSFKELAELAREAGLGGFQWSDAELSDLYLQHERGDPGETEQSAEPARPASVAKLSATSISRAELDQTVAALIDAIGALISNERESVAAVEARVKALEGRQYAGTWKSGAAYRKGAMVTLEGSLFIARHDYPSKPGTPKSGWQLAVKRGRDGKDQR